MGLDMYLTKRIYIGSQYPHREVKGKIELSARGKPIKVNFDKVSEIIELVGYWRKANQIHAWFVKNVQNGEDDCGEYAVTQQQLKNLLDLVNEVLTNKGNAENLLLTQSGFFFGSTEYDSGYFQDLDDTKKILEEALKDEESDFYYHSSW